MSRPTQIAVSLAFGLILFSPSAVGQVSGGSMTCTTLNGTVTPTVRAEGLTELAGDIVVFCTGGTPVPAGNALPQADFTISLNVPVTSRILGAPGLSEALLIVDEPGSGLPNVPSNQLACATPLTGCPITADSGDPYDGTSGRPNVFQGVVSANTVTFHGIPLQPPGSTTGIGIPPNARVFRITNIRVNARAASLAVSGPASINASVSISPASAIPLSNSSLTIAFVQSGLVYQIRNAADTSALSTVDMSSCAAGSQCGVATLRFQENFATASKIKLQGSAQNVPGTVYNSESGFFDLNWATTNPSIAGAGVADFATRFKADFHGIPAGAQLWVAVAGSSQATLTASEGGPLSPIAATTVIGGFPAAQLTAINGAATAIWEVTGTNSAAIDTFDFPVWVVFPAQSTPSGILTINEALAPDPNDGAFNLDDGSSAQNSSFPVPRFTPFVPSGMVLSPNSGINTGPVVVSLATSGVSQSYPVSVVLRSSGLPDITGGLIYPIPPASSQTIQVSFDLTGAQAGPRDLVVTFLFEQPIRMPSAFSVVRDVCYAHPGHP